jgi:hypothetical protein
MPDRSHEPAATTTRALLALALLPLLAAAGGTRAYHNEAMKVRAFEPPVGWTAQPTGSYPRLLAAYEDRDHDRLTLVAQKVAPGTTARALADESRPALERQGFRNVTVTVERPPGEDSERARLEATIDDGRRVVRQLYAVTEGIGYVMTMVGPALRTWPLKRDFDEAAQSLVVGESADTAAPRR